MQGPGGPGQAVADGGLSPLPDPRTSPVPAPCSAGSTVVSQRRLAAGHRVALLGHVQSPHLAGQDSVCVSPEREAPLSCPGAGRLLGCAQFSESDRARAAWKAASSSML